MQNQYKSKCCKSQVDIKKNLTNKIEDCPVYHLKYVCQKCHKECEVISMIDTPGGVSKEEERVMTEPTQNQKDELQRLADEISANLILYLYQKNTLLEVIDKLKR